MHQRRREMALLDVGVQVLALATANGFDEVFPVTPAFATRRPRLLLLAQESLVGVVPFDGQVTFRAVEDVADAVAVGDQPLVIAALPNARLVVRHPMADFKDDHHLLAVLVEFEVGHLGVRSDLIVVEHKMAAHRKDLGRQRHAQAPAADVHLVNALVADVAIAVVPIPVPVVVKAVGIERTRGRRPQPQVVINAPRDGTVRLLADRVAPFETKPASHINVADHALPQFLHGFAQRGGRTAVCAVLDDAVVFACGGDQLLAFPITMRAGLFDINVLARLASPDPHQRVPVIRRGDRDGVNRLVFEQLANVHVLYGPLARVLFNLAASLLEHGIVHIADGGDLDVGHPGICADVRLALPVAADHGDTDHAVRTAGVCLDVEAERGRSGGGGGILDEIASLHCDSLLVNVCFVETVNRELGKSMITAGKSAILAVTTIISRPIKVFRKESSCWKGNPLMAKQRTAKPQIKTRPLRNERSGAKFPPPRSRRGKLGLLAALLAIAGWWAWAPGTDTLRGRHAGVI